MFHRSRDTSRLDELGDGYRHVLERGAFRGRGTVEKRHRLANGGANFGIGKPGKIVEEHRQRGRILQDIFKSDPVAAGTWASV